METFGNDPNLGTPQRSSKLLRSCGPWQQSLLYPKSISFLIAKADLSPSVMTAAGNTYLH